MSRTEIRDSYYELSGAASGVARTLALAGIAIVWVFRERSESGYRIPEDLHCPATIFVIALGCDLLQYAYQASALGIFNWLLHQRGVREARPVKLPAALPAIATILWSAKMAATIIGFFFLLKFMSAELLSG
jgi:hypothetical protein